MDIIGRRVELVIQSQSPGYFENIQMACDTISTVREAIMNILHLERRYTTFWRGRQTYPVR